MAPRRAKAAAGLHAAVRPRLSLGGCAVIAGDATENILLCYSRRIVGGVCCCKHAGLLRVHADCRDSTEPESEPNRAERPRGRRSRSQVPRRFRCLSQSRARHSAIRPPTARSGVGSAHPPATAHPPACVREVATQLAPSRTQSVSPRTRHGPRTTCVRAPPLSLYRAVMGPS